jgi:hypothetical protein
MQSMTVSVSDASGGVEYSRAVRFDDFAPSNISVQCVVSGTVNYTIESSLDDPNDPVSPVAENAMVWVPTSDTGAVGATSTVQSNFLFAPKFARIKLNSGSGSVRATFLQSSSGPK